MMRLGSMATGALILLSLAGCQRTAYNDASYSAPPPLTAQPVPSVQGGQLPPPGAGATGGQFPAAPATQTLPPAGQPGAMASAGGLDVTKEALVGSWRVNGSCDMFLTLTNLGSGSRGGTRGCAGELTAMGSWEVSGKQVLLKDRTGNPIGSVVKTADNRFEGRTNSGQPITLSR